jgi:uncharacterized membrane protein
MRMIAIGIIALLIGGCMRFSGCGSEQPPAGGLGADLAHLGVILLWVGAGSIVVGLAARTAFTVARFAPVGAALARIPILGSILQSTAAFIASIGAFAFVTGCAVRWLADNLWAFWATLVCAALAVAWVHRRDIRRWLGIRPTSGAKAVSP